MLHRTVLSVRKNRWTYHKFEQYTWFQCSRTIHVHSVPMGHNRGVGVWSTKTDPFSSWQKTVRAILPT